MWKLEVLSAGLEGGTRAADWQELLDEINELTDEYKLAKSVVYKYGPEFQPDANFQELAKTINEIITFLENGKKLSFMNRRLLNPSWDKAIKSIRINRVPPSEKAHFEAILTVIDHRCKRELVLSRWHRQVTELGGPNLAALTSEPEDLMEQLAKELEFCLGWYLKNWVPIKNQLESVGLQWEKLRIAHKPDLVKYSELLHLRRIIDKELAPIIESYLNKMEWEKVSSHLLQLSNMLEPYKESASRVTQLLREAIQQRNVDKYKKAYETTCFLWTKNEILQRRNALLTRMMLSAPDWAAVIAKREGIHGEAQPPGDMPLCWKLKQLQGELERRSGLSVDDLQKQLRKARDEFKDITLQLVEKKAWLALKRKTTLRQQNALMGWKLLMRKVGKGTGIRAPHLLAEARELMPQCQTAVPVWIMPISRVVESFRPDSNRFDVVIVDEASQADVMALTALYLGKQVVVVGDDEQVSPDAVGQKQEEVQKIIDMHLAGIPNAALYDGQTSIYDLAKTSFSGMTQLREHFRCVEPIIQFSNGLSYRGTIVPLRDSSNVVTRPFTVEYRVEGAISGSKTNQVEARTVASLIMACIEHKEYKDATFGVISLLGEEQAVEIDKYLHKYLPATEYKKRKIRCGNSSQFQGDERDVIFLSMVHASAGEGPLSRLADPGERMKKRYNVAASRARNQMWLVHSLNASMDLKEGDLRKRLLDHFKNPEAATEQFKQLEPRAESEFEKGVIRRLLNEGYKVIPQWKVGSYRIDMVVEGAGKRLAIECDGDRWHPIDKIGEDMARQAVLERLGWTFIRIRGSEFFRSPDVAMKKIFEKLEAMGIARELHQMKDEAAAADDDSLKSRIIARAAEIRREWEAQQEEYTLTVAAKKKVESKKSIPILEGTEKIQPITREQDTPKPIAKTDQKQMDLFEVNGLLPPIASQNQLELFEIKQSQPIISSTEEKPFDLCSFLAEKNIPYVDKRDKGGALWAIGDWSLNRVMKELLEEGVHFHYLKSGSTASKRNPAWFTKWGG